MPDTIELDISCLATLARFEPQGKLTVPAGETPESLRKRLDMPREDVNLAFVNGENAPWDRPLADGDSITFVPLVGGG